MNSIYWLSRPYDGLGNAFGYSVHNRMMYDYTKRYIDLDDPNADLFLQIVPADHYRRVPNKINALFTMFEMLAVPESYKPALRDADYVLTPCKFVKDLFAPYTKRPPIVIQEGVEPKEFPYYQRTTPDFVNGERFRIYWSGAPNPRKGYQYMTELIKEADMRPDREYYLKTTMPKGNPLEQQEEAKKHLLHDKIDAETRKHLERIASGENIDKFYEYYSKADTVKVYGKHKNVLFDTRRVSLEELKELYNKAHVFLFPSQGEGWGLMGTEALCTGCPVIAPMHTGIKEYFDAQVGFPIGFTTRFVDASNYNLRAGVFVPYMDEMFEQINNVQANYKEALERGKRGAKRMRNKYTWDIAGQKLASWLKKI